jgi:LacI family repressor for deo operon, udp, cdd, tsx, nupC, and nupG
MDMSDLPVTIGLVVVRPALQLGDEPFYHEFIAGIERYFSSSGTSLLVQIVADYDSETATYRRWATNDSVAGVLLTDLRLGDDRVRLLEQLELAAVVVGDPESAQGLSSVWTGDGSSMRLAVQELHSRGHRVLGRVSGPRLLAHSQIRSETFRQICTELAISAIEEESDYSEDGGQLSTRMLLARATRPTAIIFDDDLMALGGLRELEVQQLAVPRDVSVLAWDDSVLCQLSKPRLSVMGHDVQIIGELAGDAILETIDHRGPTHREGPVASFISRESVGPAPRA